MYDHLLDHEGIQEILLKWTQGGTFAPQFVVCNQGQDPLLEAM